MKAKKKNRYTKHKMSLEESRELDFLDSIDTNEECINIVANPQKYFEKSLNISEKQFYIICVKFSIMSKIREIDTKTIISNKTSSHFIEKYSMDKWIDILVNLYIYYSSLMKYILDNYENTLLDLYNDKQINKDVLKIGMINFQETRKFISEDVKLIEECIEELEKDKISFKNIG